MPIPTGRTSPTVTIAGTPGCEASERRDRARARANAHFDGGDSLEPGHRVFLGHPNSSALFSRAVDLGARSPDSLLYRALTSASGTRSTWTRSFRDHPRFVFIRLAVRGCAAFAGQLFARFLQHVSIAAVVEHLLDTESSLHRSRSGEEWVIAVQVLESNDELRDLFPIRPNQSLLRCSSGDRHACFEFESGRCAATSRERRSNAVRLGFERFQGLERTCRRTAWGVG